MVQIQNSRQQKITMTNRISIVSVWICVCLSLLAVDVGSFAPTKLSTRTRIVFLQQSSSSNGENDPGELSSSAGLPEQGDDELEIINTSELRIDDGGSNLTDRFKYKMHALMGDFNPPTEMDNENENGNILSALLTFPVTYSFNVVGRTSGNETKKEDFVEQVKAAVASVSGPVDQDLACLITPRGKSFTKVSIEAQVQSAAMITTIYTELKNLEMSVMQF
jgi:putative lipoic acid-binding regulatory protein